MVRYLRFLFLFSFAALFLSGCTYHGSLRNDFHTIDQLKTKLPLKACLIFDSNLENAHYVRENIYFSHSVDISNHPGMKQAMANTFDSLFEKVTLSPNLDQEKCSGADIIVLPTIEIREHAMYMSMLVKKYDSDEVLQKYESAGNIVHGIPASVHILGFFNIAFSAGLLSPIISPAITQILGQEAESALEVRVSSCLNQIANNMRNDRSLVKKAKKVN